MLNSYVQFHNGQGVVVSDASDKSRDQKVSTVRLLVIEMYW